MNGDQLEYELQNIDTPPEKRSDWPLPSFDARDWAKHFCKIAGEKGFVDANGKPIDEGWILSWFATALMRGYDEAASKACRWTLTEPFSPKAGGRYYTGTYVNDPIKGYFNTKFKNYFILDGKGLWFDDGTNLMIPENSVPAPEYWLKNLPPHPRHGA